MNQELSSRLDQLIAASGGRIWKVSGDRSTEEQTRLYNEAVAKYGPDEAPNWVAPPGTSNHEKGEAVDLGGDLDLAHQLAPRFGLTFPMSWEPWHVQRADFESNSGYTPPPVGFNPVPSASSTSPTRPDLAGIIKSMLGGPLSSDIFSTPDPLLNSLSALSGPRPSLSPARASSTPFTTLSGGPDGIDSFMAKIRAIESSGNYSAEGVSTPWGTATGAYQFLDGTWNNYGGYARAKDAPASVQDAKARELMQTYYHQFGNWDDVAAAWYAGPAGDFQSGEVRQYVDKVRSA